MEASLADACRLNKMATVDAYVFYFLLTAMRGLQGPRLRHHLQQASRRRNRASILSLKSLLFRLCFVLGGPLVGYSADTLGLHPTLLLLGAAFALALPPLLYLFLTTLPRKTQTESG